MNLRRNVLVAAFVAATTLGVTGCNKHDNSHQAAAPQAQTQTQAAPVAAPAAPVTPAATQPAAPHRDNAEEKQAKLATLEDRDRATLQAMGYTATAPVGFGTCTTDGANDGSGYHGVSTAITYAVVHTDKTPGHWEVCVSHKGGKPTVQKFVALP